jgi:hypothetical protein
VLRWWLERVRALDFAAPDAVEQARRRTGGVPLLVGALDRLLLGKDVGGGFNVTPDRFQAALAGLAADGPLTFASFGELLKIVKRAPQQAPHQFDLLRLRNALAHGHHVGWHAVLTLRRVEQQAGC